MLENECEKFSKERCGGHALHLASSDAFEEDSEFECVKKRADRRRNFVLKHCVLCYSCHGMDTSGLLFLAIQFYP